MNKGLFVHIITTVVYILLAVFVLYDVKLNVGIRFMIVLFWLMSQAGVILYNTDKELYE
jgi:hypothetical protein